MEIARSQVRRHSTRAMSAVQLCLNAAKACCGWSELNPGKASHGAFSRRPRGISADVAASVGISFNTNSVVAHAGQAGHTGAGAAQTGGEFAGAFSEKLDAGGAAHPLSPMIAAKNRRLCVREFWTGREVNGIVRAVYQPVAAALRSNSNGVGIFASFSGVRRGGIHCVVDFSEKRK